MPAASCSENGKSTALWVPPENVLQDSEMVRFLLYVRDHYPSAAGAVDYESLWKWSVSHLSEFWESVWEFLGIKASQRFTKVIENEKLIEKAKFFVGARLNFAENLLVHRDDSPAYIFESDNSKTRRVITYKQLYHKVAQLAKRLREMGIRPGDRVAAYIPNVPEAGIAMLAATSIGAVWSSCSPDFGHQGVLDRFQQISPRVLFATDGYFFKGKRIETLDKLAQLAVDLPTVEKVVIFNYTLHPDYQISYPVKNAISYDDFIAQLETPVAEEDDIKFEQLPFDHPVYIMYSSGTTGLPKCIVQGVGVLVNHLKELVLHTDLRRGDRIFYYTTTGWMMWNWLTSSLGVGATICLFDGNPLHPDASSLWKTASELKVKIFGTSARYLGAVLQSGLSPDKYDLSHLRTICSTGSPATTSVFEFVYKHIKPEVQFASISGGTDLNGCFALGCPLKPVYDGELQCLGLGMNVSVFDDDGKEIREAKGELVCRSPFPSMPLYFWNDESGAKYHDAYFDTFENIWRHGDYAELTSHGGLIIHGRSDATLNPGGVRIGTADIYRLLEEQMKEIADSVVIGQDYSLPDGTPDVRVILFVRLADGLSMSKELESKIKSRIRDECSPRHVPWKLIACPDVPYTVSGKKVELAVRDIMNGKAVKNKTALKNPDSLLFFEKLAVSMQGK